MRNTVKLMGCEGGVEVLFDQEVKAFSLVVFEVRGVKLELLQRNLIFCIKLG